MQLKYASNGTNSIVDSVNLSLDEKFFVNINKLLEENYQDEDFGIVELCRLMCISRMQLHRKLKALTNLSASHFIRNFRMRKANKLLIDSNLTISEIAYEVGFRNPSYFSAAFIELFGKSPSQFRG